MKESTIFKFCMVIASAFQMTLFQNVTGKGWVGRCKKLRHGEVYYGQAGDMVIHDARPLNAGLHKGSGDGIGWRQVVITADMVGTTIAQFCSLETKTESGRATKEQLNWHDNIIGAGGFSFIAHSPQEFKDALEYK